MDIQSAYINRFDTIRQEVEKLSSLISTLSQDGAINLAELCTSLPPREREELSYTLSHTITVLYTALLRCQGTDASKHSISKETERLQSYLDKLTGKDGRISVDVNASDRMIQHHLRQ